MKRLLTLSFLLLCLHQSYGQANTDIFDELQGNVWYMPTADNKADIYVTSIGKGDTIIALHGGPGNDFNYLTGALRGNANTNTFILFDQRGSLLSPVNDSVIHTLTLDILVEDLETMRKVLKQNKITLFGHSFGSLLALSYYLKYPEHVNGIILSATMPPYLTPGEPFSEILKDIHKRSKDLMNRPEVTDAIRKAGLLNDTSLNPIQRTEKYKIRFASIAMYNIANWRKMQGGFIYYNALVDGAIGESIPEFYDIRPVLDKFPVPVTIIQGDIDFIDPSANYWKPVLSDYDFVELKVVKNSSHYIWLDNSTEFDSNLRYAIDRIF